MCVCVCVCVMNLSLLGCQATCLCFVPIMPVSIVTTKGSSVDGPSARGFPFPSLLATVPFSEISTLKKDKKKKANSFQVWSQRGSCLFAVSLETNPTSH